MYTSSIATGSSAATSFHTRVQRLGAYSVRWRYGKHGRLKLLHLCICSHCLHAMSWSYNHSKQTPSHAHLSHKNLNLIYQSIILSPSPRPHWITSVRSMVQRYLSMKRKAPPPHKQADLGTDVEKRTVRTQSYVGVSFVVTRVITRKNLLIRQRLTCNWLIFLHCND